MLWRVEVALKDHVRDVHGHKVSNKIKEELGIEAGEVRTIKVYTVEGLEKDEIEKVLELGVLHDPVLHTPSLEPLAKDFAWNLEVGFRPGVTDNEGRTAKESVILVTDSADVEAVKVYTSTQYLLLKISVSSRSAILQKTCWLTNSFSVTKSVPQMSGLSLRGSS